MPDTPLNPDALEAMSRVMNPPAWDMIDREPEDELVIMIKKAELGRAERLVGAYLAVAQSEVTSVEELDALPPESYVQGWDGFKRAKTHSGDWVLCVEHTRGSHKSESIELPARVLYRPEAQDA